MALFFIEGFDTGDFSRWYENGFGSITTTRFSSGRSASIGSNVSTVGFSPVAQLFAGFAFNSNAGTRWTNDMLRLFTDAGATLQLSLSIKSAGVLSLYLGGNGGGTLLGTATIPSTGWMYLEVSATINSTGGAVVVRLNGVTVISYTGNTKNGGTSTSIDTISFSGSINNYYFDDLYMCDATGTTNNTFLGDVRVQTLMPNGAGSSTQLTPTGSASNYVNVSEIPDNTATYNSSSTVGQRDTYAMADLVATTNTIYGIQNNIVAWKSDAGTAGIKPSVLTNSTLYYSPTIMLSASPYSYASPVLESNPVTGVAWTAADVNGAEFGAEVA